MANKDKDEEQGMDELEDESSYDDDEDYDEEEDDVDEDEDYDEEAEDDEFEDDDFGSEEDGEADPFWWTPHVVLAVLLLIGVLGAFGFFNTTLGFLAAVSPEDAQDHRVVATAEPVKKEAAKPKAGALNRAEKLKPAAAGDVYGAKHLLVMYKGSKRAPAAITRTKVEAVKRVAEAAKKAAAVQKANPKIDDRSKAFSKLVAEYSDEPGAARRGGDLGRFRKGSMVPQFQAAVEKMKRGDVSGVVETPFGYHVILRTF